MVEAFSANCSDQSFNEWMREGNEGYRFDFRHAEDSQVRLPLMESIQRIVVGAEIFLQSLASNRSIEHPAQCLAINDPGMNSESDNARSVLIHNDQHPVRAQCHDSHG